MPLLCGPVADFLDPCRNFDVEGEDFDSPLPRSVFRQASAGRLSGIPQPALGNPQRPPTWAEADTGDSSAFYPVI